MLLTSPTSSLSTTNPISDFTVISSPFLIRSSNSYLPFPLVYSILILLTPLFPLLVNLSSPAPAATCTFATTTVQRAVSHPPNLGFHHPSALSRSLRDRHLVTLATRPAVFVRVRHRAKRVTAQPRQAVIHHLNASYLTPRPLGHVRKESPSWSS